MLNFISFGSGSSGNCYLLYTEKSGLLIDSGIGVRTLKRYFREYGISQNVVHNVLVTHDHADHIKSVGSLSHEYKVPVYATDTVHKGIVRNYCVSRKVPQENIRRFEIGETINVGQFSVTPFPVPHDSSECVGYKVDCEGITFCIITDCGHITDEIKRHITEADYLVIEANHDEEMLCNGPYPKYLQERILSDRGHLSNKNCATAIAENMSEKLKHVWLCHLSEENNHPELARKTVENVLRSYGIVAGTDIKLEVLKRKTPTGIFELN